jgi:dipeptidyl-peptidase III
MRKTYILTGLILMIMMFACTSQKEKKIEKVGNDNFNYVLAQFADLRILRYQVSGFEQLSLPQKELIYYLSQAAICGRDILWDQNGKYNLAIRKTLENIYETYSGDRQSDEFKKFEVYLKRVWFSNGIYHHYASDKIIPDFTKEYFAELISKSKKEGFPLLPGKSVTETSEFLIPVIFDKNILGKKVCLEPGKDLVTASAVNFYYDVTEKEVEEYYKTLRNEKDTTPVSYGLNTSVLKVNGKITEVPWKSGGLYGPAIDKIVFWLNKALTVTETSTQTAGIKKLIEFYNSGDLKTWDDYNILWVKDTSGVDFVNGFIEVYTDPLGRKGAWESIVNFKDIEATRRTEIIAGNAQWFEDHSPVDGRFRKKVVKGISAKVITVAMLGGECYPYTPIGINLPNADWIRRDFGSKSVTLENITYAYDRANQGNGSLEEFCYDSTEIDRAKKYQYIADNLHTDLHECLGHGSGQLMPGVGDQALKNYFSTLEEARADLFALYYMMDPKMTELGLLPTLDAAKSQYNTYIRNGIMTQLRRIVPGKTIEESHMRNRQLIAKWCFEKGQSDNVIEKVLRNGKTYFKINDYEKLRSLFGNLLAEVQRIRSEGDYEAGKQLVETYGVRFDPELHKEVLERYAKLNIAPYNGFVNPEYELVQQNNEIIDVKVNYVTDYSQQMLKYSKEYSFLPIMH